MKRSEKRNYYVHVHPFHGILYLVSLHTHTHTHTPPFSFWKTVVALHPRYRAPFVQLCIPLNRRINARARNAKNRGAGRGGGRKRRNLTEDLRHAPFIRRLPSDLLTPPERRCNHPSWYGRCSRLLLAETLIFDGRVVSPDRERFFRTPLLPATGRDAIDRGKVKNTRIGRKGKKERNPGKE